MKPSLDPKPGSSKQSETDIRSIVGSLPDQSKPGPNKLDQLTSDEIDKYISNETLAQYEYSGDRHLLIYDKNQIEETSPSNIEEPEDEFFQLSTGEAKKLLRDIIRTRDQLENGQLMTKAMRDLNSAKRTLATLHQYNYSVVRLHLPDGLVLQALFKPLENVDKVEAYFRQLLERPDLDFYIYFTPPKSILQGTSTLLDLRCVPTANFYFGVNEPCPSSGCGAQVLRPPEDPNKNEDARHGTKSESMDVDEETQQVERATGDSSSDAKTAPKEKSETPSTNLEKKSTDHIGNVNPIVDKELSVIEATSETKEASNGLSNAVQGSANRPNSSESLNDKYVVRYVRADVVEKHLVSRSVADAKAAEFRRAKNPALRFMDEPEPCPLTHSSQSPSELITPSASNLNRPKTSADKIPKWFKPGGK